MVDLTDLKWNEQSDFGSSFGYLNKAESFDSEHHYYKMSRMLGQKVVGYESVYEVVVSRLLDILNIPHVQYDLYRCAYQC